MMRTFLIIFIIMYKVQESMNVNQHTSYIHLVSIKPAVGSCNKTLFLIISKHNKMDKFPSSLSLKSYIRLKNT